MAKKKRQWKMPAWWYTRAGKRARKITKTVLKCLCTILLIGIITASIVGCVMVVYVVSNFSGNEGIPDLQTVGTAQTSMIMRQNDNGQWEETQWLEGTSSVWVPYEDIPMNMKNAVIAIEDERFREHDGVDWKRTVAAFANLLLHFSSQEYGGSTITQQLIKITTGDDGHTIERKVTEILRAIEMERNYYTKDQILEAYLNLLPLSGNITGVGAAANYYFGVDANDLSLAQCAVIASITQNPSKYNPYTHPENVRLRQHTVLTKMHELGFITDDEYKQAYNEELRFRSSIENVQVQDYYTDLLIEDVIADLREEYGYSYTMAQSMVYSGGLRIYSYENRTDQMKVQSVFENESNFPSKIKSDKSDPQGAILIMDYEGRVVATAGGRGEKTANRVLNRATASTRQPGSAMKPIAVYAPAIEYNITTFSSMVRDMYITLPNGDKWPHNYESAFRDNGDVLVCVALQKSLNTVPARLLEQLTPQRSYNFVTGSLRMSSLVPADMDRAPLALGGLTKGVICRDMAAAYQVFGNGGRYNKPSTYEKVTLGDNTLLQHKTTGEQVISTESAYVMNKMLQRVVRQGTGRAIAGSWGGAWEVYAKTGTTNDNKDVYFAGGTPYYVGASWFGYDYNKSLSSSQTSYARTLWNKAMTALHKGKSAKGFGNAGGTVVAEFCTKTGMLATPGCTDHQTGYYKPDNVPGYCTQHGGGGAAVTTQAPYQDPGITGSTSAATAATQATAAATTAVAPAA